MGMRNRYYDSSTLDSFGSQVEEFSTSVISPAGEVLFEFFSGNSAWDDLRLFVGGWLNVGAKLHVAVAWDGPKGPSQINGQVLEDLADNPVRDRPKGWGPWPCPVELAAPGSPRVGDDVSTPEGVGIVTRLLTEPPRYQVRIVTGPRKKRVGVEKEFLPKEISFPISQ